MIGPPTLVHSADLAEFELVVQYYERAKEPLKETCKGNPVDMVAQNIRRLSHKRKDPRISQHRLFPE
jgi:hypothetical protein